MSWPPKDTPRDPAVQAIQRRVRAVRAGDKPARSIKNRPEQVFQQALMEELDLRLIAPAYAWHVPNQGKRSDAEAGHLKRMGRKAGVHDVHLIWPDAMFGTLELKVDDRAAAESKLTDEQAAFAGRMSGCGHLWAEVSWSPKREHVGAVVARVIALLRGWGVELR